MNKFNLGLSIFLIILFFSTNVFAIVNIDKTTDKNINIEKFENIQSLFDNKIIDMDLKFNIVNISENFKKQKLSQELINRDFIIFNDPVIFQDFVQFSDSVSMFESYIQHLFTDIISVEEIEVEILDVNNQANIEELFVEDQAIFQNGMIVENVIESEIINTNELDADEVYISGELIIDEDLKVISLAQNSDNEYAYACLNIQGEFFRSNIPCHELNINSEVELWFIQIGEIINIDFQENEFQIELLDIFNETPFLENSALFRINGDYDIIKKGDEVNIAGLSIELDDILFDENNFQRLKITLHEVLPLIILNVENFPFEYEFTNLYENLRFSYSDVSDIQDIEIIFAESITGDTTLEVNDESTGTVLAGESITLGNIEMDIISTNFINDSLDSMVVVIQDIY